MSEDPEDLLWEKIAALDAEEACTRTLADYDKIRDAYILKMFNADMDLSPGKKTITAATEEGRHLLEGLGEFAGIGALHYLVYAKDLPLAERLIHPKELPGGEIYRKGTHMLPLDRVSRLYGSDTAGFLEKGKTLGGVQYDCGDAGILMYAFPRIPLVLALWAESDEFPAEATLLFDSSCRHHLPGDIIWAVAMMSIELFLRPV
ncbi:MAG: DUF3786 domain-containing protein [Spirochaetales bacterium]|nr:MAG: DUF3786 domain-containing protein [Spirochaetales bacterium]